MRRQAPLRLPHKPHPPVPVPTRQLKRGRQLDPPQKHLLAHMHLAWGQIRPSQARNSRSLDHLRAQQPLWLSHRHKLALLKGLTLVLPARHNLTGLRGGEDLAEAPVSKGCSLSKTLTSLKGRKGKIQQEHRTPNWQLLLSNSSKHLPISSHSHSHSPSHSYNHSHSCHHHSHSCHHHHSCNNHSRNSSSSSAGGKGK